MSPLLTLSIYPGIFSGRDTFDVRDVEFDFHFAVQDLEEKACPFVIGPPDDRFMILKRPPNDADTRVDSKFRPEHRIARPHVTGKGSHEVIRHALRLTNVTGFRQAR